MKNVSTEYNDHLFNAGNNILDEKKPALPKIMKTKKEKALRKNHLTVFIQK